jgi:hypothetical protein
MHDTVEFARPNGEDGPPKDKTQALLKEVLKRLDGERRPDDAFEGSPPKPKPQPGERKPVARIPWNRGLQNTN